MKVVRGKITAIDRREAVRYMGYAGVKSAQGIEDVIEECEALLLPVLSPVAVYAPFPLKAEGDALDLGFARVRSNSLARNLKGCGNIVLFAATVGAGTDRLIARYNRLSPARALILQALGAAAVEQWCDDVNGRITAEYGSSRPRFSCGYGDLPLSLQRQIFPALDVTKNTGITLTEGDLMMPSKSVTAIVGILENQEDSR